MKSLTFIALVLFGTITPTVLAQSPVGTPAPQASQQTQNSPWAQRFKQLSKENQDKYRETYVAAMTAYQQKRVTDCILSVQDLEKICPDNPEMINLLGSCYVELRNATKAVECFKKVITLEPGNTSTAFNLAEVYYVSRNYGECITFFERLIPVLEAQPGTEAIVDLIHFKLFIAYTKLKNTAKADALAKRRTVKDDTPYQYFVQMVLKKEAKDAVGAQTELNAARYIYGDTAVFASYLDAATEAGYIESLDKTMMIQ